METELAIAIYLSIYLFFIIYFTGGHGEDVSALAPFWLRLAHYI